jgi:hypothetical protein
VRTTKASCSLIVRVPASAREALERRADAIRREHPGLHITIGGVVRDLVLRGLRESHAGEQPHR